MLYLINKKNKDMKFRILFGIILVSLIFSSCKMGGEVKIGFLIHSLANSRWQGDLKYLKEKAGANGVEIIVREAKNDEDIQLKQAEELINEGVDVLIVVAANQNTAAAIVREANDKGVPVISYDRLIRNAELSCYLSFNYEDVGKQMIEYAVSKKPEGNYIFLWGDASDANARFISKGHLEAIQPYIDNGKISILSRQYIDDYSSPATINAISEIYNFTSKPIDAVICGSGTMAEAVVDFFWKGEYPTHVIITGQDLTAKSRSLIKEGKLDMTVHKSVKDLAYNAIDIALDLAKDGRLKKSRDYKYVNNGRKEIPSILLPATTVTIQNLDKFVNAD